MICAEPVLKGPNKGKPATGLWAGYFRHRKNNEPLCVECRKAYEKPRRSGGRSSIVVTGRTEGLPLVNPRTEPMFVGWTYVKCAVCGSRGKANAGVVGKRGVIDGCVNCK